MIVYLKDCNNNLETAMKRLKRYIEYEGIFDEVHRRREFEKPSDKKRRKNREAAYRAKTKNKESENG